jgi:hypothetical protein
MSSTRAPGFRSSLAAMCAHLASCAASRLVEEIGIEVVVQIVVAMDVATAAQGIVEFAQPGGGVAQQAVQAAALDRADHAHRHFQHVQQIAVGRVPHAVHIALGEAQLGIEQDLEQGRRTMQPQHRARLVLAEGPDASVGCLEFQASLPELATYPVEEGLHGEIIAKFLSMARDRLPGFGVPPAGGSAFDPPAIAENDLAPAPA